MGVLSPAQLLCKVHKLLSWSVCSVLLIIGCLFCFPLFCLRSTQSCLLWRSQQITSIRSKVILDKLTLHLFLVLCAPDASSKVALIFELQQSFGGKDVSFFCKAVVSPANRMLSIEREWNEVLLRRNEPLIRIWTIREEYPFHCKPPSFCSSACCTWSRKLMSFIACQRRRTIPAHIQGQNTADREPELLENM